LVQNLVFKVGLEGELSIFFFSDWSLSPKETPNGFAMSIDHAKDVHLRGRRGPGSVGFLVEGNVSRET
jgi:hypothetical protein